MALTWLLQLSPDDLREVVGSSPFSSEGDSLTFWGSTPSPCPESAFGSLDQIINKSFTLGTTHYGALCSFLSLPSSA